MQLSEISSKIWSSPGAFVFEVTMDINDAQAQTLVREFVVEAKRKNGFATPNPDTTLIADFTLSILTFGPLLNVTDDEGNITNTNGLKEAISRLVICSAIKNGDPVAERLLSELSRSKLQEFCSSAVIRLKDDDATKLAVQVRTRVLNVLRGGRLDYLEAPLRLEDLVELLACQVVRQHYLGILKPAWVSFKLRYAQYLKSLETRAMMANNLFNLLEANSLCFRRAFLRLTRISKQWIAICYYEGQRKSDAEIIDLITHLGWHGKQGIPIEYDDVDRRLSYHLKDKRNGLAVRFSEELADALEQLVQISQGSHKVAGLHDYLVSDSLKANRKQLEALCERGIGAYGELVSDELRQLCRRLSSAIRGGGPGKSDERKM